MSQNSDSFIGPADSPPDNLYNTNLDIENELMEEK